VKKSAVIIAVLAVFMASGFSLNLNKVGKAIKTTAKAAKPMSEGEEYYLGRAVAAKILSEYDLLEDEGLTRYVNLVGRTTAIHSDKPFTYGGYHFAILESDEINAFACPGGTIFITKGMFDALKNEDELAAVLAHEVAHINNRDGRASIKKSRWIEVAALIGTEAASEFGSDEVKSLAGLLEGSVDDVFKALVVKGYGKKQEYKADTAALNYLSRAGYGPTALQDFLERLKDEKSEGGILKTHPKYKDRLKKVKKNMPETDVEDSLVNKRAERFNATLTSVLSGTEEPQEPQEL
jgi:predicted Zn-dependent protease